MKGIKRKEKKENFWFQLLRCQDLLFFFCLISVGIEYQHVVSKRSNIMTLPLFKKVFTKEVLE